jgi:tetratricopeptide (TPR) repeat protein
MPTNVPPFVAPADPPAARYTIRVRLDPEQQLLTGKETIRFENCTCLSLPTLALTWGLPENGSYTVKMGEMELPQYASADDGPTLVPLAAPVAPGQEVELSITFTAPLPSQVYRAWPLIRFHPKLYWERPTLDDYDVQIEVPAGRRVAAGGLEGTDGVWRARGAPSFGALVSPDYQVMEAEAHDTLIRAFYRPAGKECATLLLETAVDVVDYYHSEFGFYPYPFLTIVPGVDRVTGAVPLATGLVAIHGEEQFAEARPDHFRWITAHEIGHQYWGECVADDDPAGGWLWLGLGLYMDREYTRARELEDVAFGREDHRAHFFGSYLSGVTHGVDTTIARPPEEIAQVDFDYSKVVRHGKGFAAISALESVLGRQTFRRVYGACLQRYRGKRLGAVEFQRFCEAATGQDLDWFFSQWVHSNRQLAYKVISTSSERQADRHDSSVTVVRTGSMEMPLTVEARFEDGSRQRAVTDRLAAESKLHFASSAPLKEAVLDPDGALPLREEPTTQLQAELTRLPWSDAGERAHALFPRAKGENIDDAKLWYKLGLNLFGGAEYAEALEAFRKVKELFPEGYGQAVALVWCGHLLDLDGKREEALACYREAKQLGLPGPVRYDHFHMVIDMDWIEARLQTPFVWPAADVEGA